MEILNSIEQETMGSLSPIFQTLKTTSLDKVVQAQKKLESRYISIDFYQTKALIPYCHYKHISKIFTTHDDPTE
jgi:hypothetical protein